ncbi:hypothetical protein ACRAWD_07350 [Caulobacter segnis]
MPADIHHQAAPEARAAPERHLPARQGRWGKHVFWVLIASTVLAALALFGAWSWRAPDLASVEVNNGAKTPRRGPALRHPADAGPPDALAASSRFHEGGLRRGGRLFSAGSMRTAEHGSQ